MRMIFAVLALLGSSFAQFTQNGNYTITGLSSTGTISLPSTPTITSGQLPNGTQGSAYSTTLTASGGTLPYAWSVDAQLPAGLSLNTSTGVISGIPTTTGTSTFNITVTDANLLVSPPQANSITIAASATLTLQSVTFPQANVGSTYSFTQPATGGTGNYTSGGANCVILTGSLPTPITIASSSTGCAYSSGASNVTASVGTYSGTAKITDSGGNTATQNWSITVINGPPTTYTSPTDTAVHSISIPPPNVGGLVAGSGGGARCITDSYTGAKIMRITDKTTAGGARFVSAFDAGDFSTINADGTLAIVKPEASNPWVVPFNFSACTVGTAFKLPTPSGRTSYNWSESNRAIIWQISGTVVSKCTVDDVHGTTSCVPFFDYANNPGSTTHSANGLLPGYRASWFGLFSVESTEQEWTMIFAGGPPWASGTYANNLAILPINNNAGAYTFRNQGGVSCTTGGTEPSSWNQTVNGTTADGTCTWTNIGKHKGQDVAFDMMHYSAATNCFTHMDTEIGSVLTSDCQPTGAVNYSAGGHGDVHDAEQTPNPGYSTIGMNPWTTQGAGSFIWQIGLANGSLTATTCGDPYNHTRPSCSGHKSDGYLGVYQGAPNYQLHPWGNPGNVGPQLFSMSSKLGQHGTYTNHGTNDLPPVCLYTTYDATPTVPYTLAYQNELDCAKTDGSQVLYRMFHVFNSNMATNFNPAENIGQNAASGLLSLFPSDWMGTMGSKSGANTCTSGTPGCVTSPNNETCVAGYTESGGAIADGLPWQASTAYPANYAMLPGFNIGACKGNANCSAFVSQGSGTSGATAPTWCQTKGCTVNDNGITWTNIGPGDCRTDIFIGVMQ